MNTTIPAWFHPSTLVAVDDNESLLDMLTMVLPTDLPYNPYLSTQDALAALQQQAATAPFLNDDTSPVWGAPFNPDRFACPSVLMIDYELPGTTGIAFIEKLGSHPIRRLLFSGSNGNAIANQAIDAGILDRSLHKQDWDVFDKLTDTITELQQLYFTTLTADVRSPLLNSTAIGALLQETHNHHGTHEHYLYRDNSGFLLLDIDGAAYDLHISTTPLDNNNTLSSGELNDDTCHYYWQLTPSSSQINSQSQAASFNNFCAART